MNNSEYYDEFERLYRESMEAYQYAFDNYEVLMSRPVDHILYGTLSYGLGPFSPSKMLVKDKERILSTKTRKKEYTEYFFDENNHLLYAIEHLAESWAMVCCDIVFYKDGVEYACPFIKGQKKRYPGMMFGVYYQNDRPVRYTIVEEFYVYVEYYEYNENEDGTTTTRCTWYQYLRTDIDEKYGKTTRNFDMSAPFGSDNSPVKCGYVEY